MFYKRLLSLLVVLWMIFLASLLSAEENAKQSFAGQTLQILTWSEYLDQQLIDEFEKTYQVKLKFTYFDSDSERDDIIVQHGLTGFDIAIVDTLKTSEYIRLGWASALKKNLLPNVSHIDDDCYQHNDNLRNYTVPYFRGSLGIAYRQDLVPQKIDSWAQIYQPDEALRGKIMMINDARELLSPGLIMLGKSVSSKDPADWRAAAEIAYQQKPYVNEYGYSRLTEDAKLLTGEVWAAQIYNGDAIVLADMNPDLVFVNPLEGSNKWIDYWVVFKESRQPALAHAFLNFINDPKNAANNAQEVYFSTCNQSAEKLLPAEFLNDERIYPSAELTGNLQVFQPIPPRTWAEMNTLFSQIVDSF